MIIRIFKVTTHPGAQDDFGAFFAEKALPMVRSHDGLVDARIGRPRPETPLSYSMVMAWRDLDAVRGFAGPDWNQAVIDPEEKDFIAGIELDHYALLGTFAPPSAPVIRIFQVTTHEGKEAEFRAFFTQTAVPLMQAQAGLRDITFCLPRPETPRDFAVVMHWESLDALKGFVGEDWSRPHIDPSEEGIVETRRLNHYELFV